MASSENRIQFYNTYPVRSLDRIVFLILLNNINKNINNLGLPDTYHKLDLTDFPPNKYDTRLFIVGSFAEIKTHAWVFLKMFGRFGILHIGLLQGPSHELGTSKQVSSAGRPPGTRRFGLITSPNNANARMYRVIDI